jgi:hypothetical protein
MPDLPTAEPIETGLSVGAIFAISSAMNGIFLLPSQRVTAKGRRAQ